MLRTSLLFFSLAMVLGLDSFAGGKAEIPVRRVTRRAHTEATPYSYRSTEIKALIGAVAKPGEKLQIYSLWVDSLKLRVEEADQKRLAGTMTQRQYDQYLDTTAKEIHKVSKEAKRLGFKEQADLWEGIAFQYTRTMGNLLDE